MNELHVLYLRGAEGSSDFRRDVHRFDQAFSDFDVELSEDLLVLWNSFSPPSTGLNIRFLSLSDGGEHKRAKTQYVEVPTETFFPGEYHPDTVIIFDVNSVQLNGELACICAMAGKWVQLLNWVTGDCWTISGSSCCILSKECVIVASCHTNPPYFDVYSIIYSVQPPSVAHVRRYRLPRTKVGILYDIECRPSPPFNASVLPVTPECPAVPFSTAPGSVMVVFSYRMRIPDVDGSHIQYALLCYTDRFLTDVQECVLGTAKQLLENVEVVNWESWGPDSSFFLGEVHNDDNIWSYALYGYRLMFEHTIYDFNPRNIASAIDREEREEGREGREGMRLCRSTSSARDDYKYFAQKIETHRAFLSAPIKKSRVPASTCCFLVDEDVLALEDTTDITDSTSRQVIITQLTVGPEWDA
ncbi:hypothetical protein EVJ58_g2479 [Rhodofomes roseus]|uniref:Uncharacterized protein n=1 Tax=Rhodofomes roseus TaxID=34475 RepID=A0A4Y9YQI7_9APHY|nr:hypothetical protein EVJ58_g2479 [Rhodofomes roseus]